LYRVTPLDMTESWEPALHHISGGGGVEKVLSCGHCYMAMTTRHAMVEMCSTLKNLD